MADSDAAIMPLKSAYETAKSTYDEALKNIGTLGDAVKNQIDEALASYRSEFNRAKSVCEDANGLDAIQSANNLVIATMAMSGTAGAAGTAGAVATWMGGRGSTDAPIKDAKDCDAAPVSGSEACTDEQQKAWRTHKIRTGGNIANVVNAVGSAGSLVTSLISRDKFMQARFRIDDCKKAVSRFKSFGTVDVASGTLVTTDRKYEVLTVCDLNGGGCLPAELDGSTKTYTEADCEGKKPADPSMSGYYQCVKWLEDCVTPSGNDAKCVDSPLTKGVVQIYEKSKARDVVEACDAVDTGKMGDYGNKMLWSTMGSGVGVLGSVISVATSGANSNLATGIASTAGAAGALASAGISLSMLMDMSEVLYRAEKCLDKWPASAEETW
jgi:hypothetical protein